MRLNFIGVFSVILAFVSLALPWWEIYVSADGSPAVSFTVYLWGFFGGPYPHERFIPIMVNVDVYGPIALTPYIALALIVIGGVLGLIASVKVTRRDKILLAVASVLSMLSIIIFIGGQYVWSRMFFYDPPIGWIASEYPSFGLWLALAGTITAFIAYMKYPKVT